MICEFRTFYSVEIFISIFWIIMSKDVFLDQRMNWFQAFEDNEFHRYISLFRTLRLMIKRGIKMKKITKEQKPWILFFFFFRFPYFFPFPLTPVPSARYLSWTLILLSHKKCLHERCCQEQINHGQWGTITKQIHIQIIFSLFRGDIFE